MSEAPVKRKRGRPGTYASAAERAKAWRERQKALIAQAAAQTLPEPVIVEKIKVVEKPIYLPAPKSLESKDPQASKLVPLIKERIITEPYGEKKAKTMRANAARVATVAREILDLLASDSRGTGIAAIEKAFLENVERFFSALNFTFENTQVVAKAASAKHAREDQQRHEQQLAELANKTFGKSPSASEVLALANDLLAFEANANAWLVKRYQVDRGSFFINRSYEFKTAIRAKDIKALIREVAYVRLDLGEQGQRFTYKEALCFTAGWANFERWRREQNGNGEEEDNT